MKPLNRLWKYADKKFVSRLTNVVSEKAIAGRARKAARAEQKEEEEAAAAEAEEEARWQQGAKGWTVADERRQKADNRSRKKKELAQITLQDEKNVLEPTKPPTRFGLQYHNFASSCRDCREIEYQLEKHIVTLKAISFNEAMKILNTFPGRTWFMPGIIPFEHQLEQAYQSFLEQENEKLHKSNPSLAPWEHDRILWRMFEKAACNPANKGLPSATAKKEDKLKMLNDMKNSLSYRTVYPGMRMYKWPQLSGLWHG